MQSETANKGRLWKHMAVASLLVPICGFVFASYGPRWFGRPYFWVYATMPIAGGIGGLLSIAAMVGLRNKKAGVWPWACSICASSVSVAATLLGCLGLFAATVFGPTYASPSYIAREAGLASIPVSSTYSNGLHRNCIGERWYFLKFIAPADDIANFVKQSTSIKQSPHSVFDANNVYTPFRLSRDQRIDLEADDQRYWAYSMSPVWFQPDITVKGRLYDFANGNRWGIVVIDDYRNEVYVFLSWH
jgi:hypothetical protein